MLGCPRNRVNSNLRVWVLTALGTGAAAWYTRQQWLVAQDSKRVAQDSEQRQTRAYVFLRDIRLERADEANWDLIPEWENTENSETVHMRSHINGAMSDIPLPDEFSFADISGRPDVPVLLDPRSVSNITFYQIATDCLTQFNRRDDVAKYYLWGWARYNDTLTDQPHQTRFCWDINRFVFSADDRSARISYSLCNTGNCADGDCPAPEKQTIEIRQFTCKPPPKPVVAAPQPPHGTSPQNQPVRQDRHSRP